MKKKIALIGIDKPGARHFNELKRSGIFELVGICDENKKGDYAKFEFFSTIDSMLAKTEPEAMIIATNNQQAIVQKCMKSVKNILIDRPKFNSLEDVRVLQYMIHTNGLNLSFFAPWRLNPTTASILRELEKEEKIYNINITYGANDQNYDIKEAICKNLDLLFYISKSVCGEIKCEMPAGEKQISNANYILRLKNGAISSISLNLNYPKDIWKVRIVGKSGLYVADLVGFAMYKITPEGRINLKVDKNDQNIALSQQNFADSCEKKENQNANIDDVLKIWETLACVK